MAHEAEIQKLLAEFRPLAKKSILDDLRAQFEQDRKGWIEKMEKRLDDLEADDEAGLEKLEKRGQAFSTEVARLRAEGRL